MSNDLRRVRVEAPADLDALDIAQAIVGPGILLKAEHTPKKRTHRIDALDELHIAVCHAYDEQVAKMLRALREYVDKNVLHRTGPSMFTPTSLHDMQQLIRDYHDAFVAGAIHPEALPAGVVQNLIDRGILPGDLAHTYQPAPNEHPPAQMEMIDESYRYGRSLLPGSVAVHGAKRDQPTRSAAQEYPHRPLVTEERHAVDWARHRAAVHIRGLGNKVADDFATVAIEADKEQRAHYEQLVRDRLETNIAKRESWRKLASDLGHRSADWSRDFSRIAATEKQAAMQAGVSEGLIERERKPPKRIRVAKQPNPDACEACIKLHLSAGRGSAPRIFTLAELQANGTNVGKKRDAWRATIGPVHPWCSCELIHVPDGWHFGEGNNLEPEAITRAGYLETDLQKSRDMQYTNTVPDTGVVIRIADPRLHAAVERVVLNTPACVFDKRVGVTLITTDMPRAQNPLDDHDLAYWTANEIRLMHNLAPERVERVLPHEIGHSLNVYLMRTLGGTQPVREWHDRLWAVSEEEGFVSDYARKMPIENAAEVSMLYIYNRKRLLAVFPRQFAFVHKYYRPVFRRGRDRKLAAVLERTRDGVPEVTHAVEGGGAQVHAALARS